jgi:hypothetical protein
MKYSSAWMMFFDTIRASAASLMPTRRRATSGAAVSGFNSAIVLGISSVRISPSVSAWRADGFLNKFRAASASSMMRRATELNCSAASVGATSFLCRMNSVVPSSASRLVMAAEIDGWEMKQRLAAAVRLRSLIRPRNNGAREYP